MFYMQTMCERAKVAKDRSSVHPHIVPVMKNGCISVLAASPGKLALVNFDGCELLLLNMKDVSIDIHPCSVGIVQLAGLQCPWQCFVHRCVLVGRWRTSSQPLVPVSEIAPWLFTTSVAILMAPKLRPCAVHVVPCVGELLLCPLLRNVKVSTGMYHQKLVVTIIGCSWACL